MYNFLNNNQGGAAGQTNTSTLPQSLFNNASAVGNRFGTGLDALKNRFGQFSQNMADNPMQTAQGMFSNMFGGQGGLSEVPHNLAQLPHDLSQIPHNLSQIPQNLSQIPQNVASGLQNLGNGVTNLWGNPLHPQNQSNHGGGFLSRFMGGNNGQN